MITDVHTHFWLPTHQTPPWSDTTGRMSKSLASEDLTTVTVENYRREQAPASQGIVFGLQAAASGMMVPNDEVAKFVRELKGLSVGFMSVDPTSHNVLEEIDRCYFDLKLKGIKIGPIYQGTGPLDPRVLRVFARAERYGLPVMIHQGAIFTSAGRLADALPILLDDVAIAFPDLRIIIAHLGHPWVHQTVTVMRRHPNIFADTSALPARPTMLASALIAAKEYGVLDRVLFGSDSPMVTATSAVETLRKVVSWTQRTGLTYIEDEELESLLHRPSFELLGIDLPSYSKLDESEISNA
ncbi:amidohydrolase family protein [Arthrobacter bambusae]|uniref:amidohydrolase family protein n=1 Tax=Arthrobacter bambusae TaxID=1338426 RepID=UPI001F50F70A|nr:amidohydrolase family protein [Arthrobacter bambusae]MCI0144191.1 amidohydrolase family protein [Arthrobacter bambusae]